MPLHSTFAGLRAFVFDAYGTLFDVHSAVMRLGPGMGPQAQAFSDCWRAKQLEYGWVLSLGRRWRNFWELTEDALDFAFARFPEVDRTLRPDLLAAYRTLSAYADARPALARLRGEGFPVGVLSNGETVMLHQAIEASGLGGSLDHVWSVDAVEIFKPDARVYQMAADGLGLRAGEICLVSSNRWDVAGATAFGMKAVWINRAGAADEYADLQPIAVLPDLGGIV